MDKDQAQPDVEETEMDKSEVYLEEYETQYFGFTPKSFCDGVYNAVNDYLHDCLNVVESYLHQEFKNIVTDEQVRLATQKLIPMFRKTFDKAFDKLETYLLTNIFHIPNNVLLPEDQCQSQRYTEEDELELEKELEDLQQKIVNAKYVNKCLEQELKDIEEIQLKYNKLLEQLQSMENVCEKAGVPNVKEAIVFTSDKVKRLHSVINNLTPLSPPRIKVAKLEDKTVIQGESLT